MAFTFFSDIAKGIINLGGASGHGTAYTKLTVGGTPSATTGNGFTTVVTQNATGDYTLNFSASFSTDPFPDGIVPVDTTAAGSQVTSGYVYSISTTQVRVRFSDDAGALTDPDSAFISVKGI